MSRLHAVVLGAALLSGCAPPDLSFAFHQMQLEVVPDADAANGAAIDLVERSKHTVQVALPALEDEALASALIDAWNDGKTVEVITDVDRSADAGVAALIAAGVPVTLADGELAYFDFNLLGDVYFPSVSTQMSHSWVIVDRQQALVGDRIGDLVDGERVLMEISGEELIEDLLSEHNQVFGGTDATATTAFDGLAKSTTDVRWRYPTQTDVDLELWFGPQERLIKRVIDAIYDSRGQVLVLSNDLTDTGLARALEDKGKWGFPVTAVVGPAFNPQANRMSRVFSQETPNVEKLRYTGADDMPTLVITDWGQGLDGQQYNTRYFLLTHDLYTTSRIEGASPPANPDAPFLGPLTDQLIDGTLWVLIDYDEPSKSTQALYDLWERHASAAGSL